MQITEKELINIISEEIDRMIENQEIEENVLDRLKATASANINPFASQANKALKKAASVLGSYSNHLLKLQQKLDMDAQKLGIDGSEDLKRVSSAIEKTQQQVQQVAKGAPTSEKMKAAIEQKFAAQQAAAAGGQQQAAPAQQQAAPAQQQQQAAPAQPAATPAATPPSTSSPGTGQKHYLRNTDNFEADKAAQDQAAAARQAKKAAAPALDDKLQAWVDGGKQPGNFNANSARAAIGTSRMGQRAGKAVFNSQEALEFGKQVVAALGDGARTGPLRQAIEDTEDVGIANEPVNEEMHQQLMSEFDAWELQFETKGESLNEQLQEISRRWGFGK